MICYGSKKHPKVDLTFSHDNFSHMTSKLSTDTYQNRTKQNNFGVVLRYRKKKRYTFISIKYLLLFDFFAVEKKNVYGIC